MKDIKQPELPQGQYRANGDICGDWQYTFTADQMRAYAKEYGALCYEAALRTQPQAQDAGVREDLISLEVNERKEFERFAKIYGSLMMEREGPGYLFRDTHISWISWQARAALRGK